VGSGHGVPVHGYFSYLRFLLALYAEFLLPGRVAVGQWACFKAGYRVTGSGRAFQFCSCFLYLDSIFFFFYLFIYELHATYIGKYLDRGDVYTGSRPLSNSDLGQLVMAPLPHAADVSTRLAHHRTLSFLPLSLSLVWDCARERTVLKDVGRLGRIDA
jgi:hypothetical protein